MPALDHVHSYVRLTAKKPFGETIFKCSHPLCYHTAKVKVIKGKMCHCKCGTDFILTREDLLRAEPKCQNCSNTREAKIHQTAARISGTVLDILHEEPPDGESDVDRDETDS